VITSPSLGSVVAPHRCIPAAPGSRAPQCLPAARPARKAGFRSSLWVTSCSCGDVSIRFGELLGPACVTSRPRRPGLGGGPSAWIRRPVRTRVLRAIRNRGSSSAPSFLRCGGSGDVWRHHGRTEACAPGCPSHAPKNQIPIQTPRSHETSRNRGPREATDPSQTPRSHGPREATNVTN
jgi:hypothetical protein